MAATPSAPQPSSPVAAPVEWIPLTVASCNLLNLALPGRAFYPNQEPYGMAEHERKLDWIGQMLRRLNADVAGVQEVWDEAALKAAVARSGLQSMQALAPGAEEFVPSMVAGTWLPPERTFAPIKGTAFLPERTRHIDVAAEHDSAWAPPSGCAPTRMSRTWSMANWPGAPRLPLPATKTCCVPPAAPSAPMAGCASCRATWGARSSRSRPSSPSTAWCARRPWS